MEGAPPQGRARRTLGNRNRRARRRLQTAGLLLLDGFLVLHAVSGGLTSLPVTPTLVMAAPGRVPVTAPAPDVPTPSAAAVYQAAPVAFVARSGATLTLDGQPFRFTGLNIYNASNLDSCWYHLGEGDALDQSLTAIGPGQAVFRTWLFQRMATSASGARDWSGFEHTLAVAQAHGERVMVTLGNEWPDCEGVGASIKYEAWYRSGYRQPAPGLPSSYRDWVAEVVSRYRDRGTIFAWQLMNEARDQANASGSCNRSAGATMRAFAADMASLVKRLDPAHLLSLGTEAGACGTAGADYLMVHAVPGIDLCEVHDYSPASPATTTGLGLLQESLSQCRSLRKPVLIGEAGIRVADAGSPAARAALFRLRFDAWLRAGVAGVLIWDWAGAEERDGDAWQVGPGDPSLAVLGGV